ncbi:NUDIX hydrolase [Streptomyces violascens]|uniref:DNA mismatch repair protein MutT n=1 Tax=Streptomyces violascens TaxID=67381 RepID=A0ABQ3QXR9_9ACTN|nr:NUDIX domain-containing protein [Streptomyces violascens]GGU18167.1 DNA mismatch repair protein MutT [Streptomyces violascens]GHI42069.1 DNA mismatch repair protein MutT [Streptomyces violascens]
MNATRTLQSVGWICIRDGRLLVVRSVGRDAFYLPGGKIEPGESHQQALVREVREELTIELAPQGLAPAMLVSATAHGLDNTQLHMHCYTSPGNGEPKPAREIQELAWVDSHDTSRCAPAVVTVLRNLHAQGQCR